MASATARKHKRSHRPAAAPAPALAVTGESGGSQASAAYKGLKRVLTTNKMKITEVDLVDRLFLLGPPGIGKTETIKRLSMERAKAMGRIFVDVRDALKDETLYERIVREPHKYYLFLRVAAPHVFPEDIQYPKPGGDHVVEFLHPKALYLFTLDGAAGTLFFDELTNVKREDQLAMYFTIFLEKEFGFGGVLSDNVYVVGAGNPAELSSVAGEGLPAPLINRLVTVEAEPPTAEEWVRYMNEVYGDRWAKDIGAFLLRYPDFLYKNPDESETFKPFPTPRSWTMLATMPPHLIEKYAAAIVGEEAAGHLNAFLKLKEKLPTIDEVLSKPEVLSGLTLDIKYLTLATLSNHPERLLKEGDKLFLYLLQEDREALGVLIAMLNGMKEAAAIARKLIALARKHGLIKVLTSMAVLITALRGGPA